MDWMITTGIVIGVWIMLSVLSGQRATQQNLLTQIAAPKAAAEKSSQQH